MCRPGRGATPSSSKNSIQRRIGRQSETAELHTVHSAPGRGAIRSSKNNSNGRSRVSHRRPRVMANEISVTFLGTSSAMPVCVCVSDANGVGADLTSACTVVDAQPFVAGGDDRRRRLAVRLRRGHAAPDHALRRAAPVPDPEDLLHAPARRPCPRTARPHVHHGQRCAAGSPRSPPVRPTWLDPTLCRFVAGVRPCI